MTLGVGERLKVTSSTRLLRGSTQGSHPLSGVWEVKTNEGDTYKLQKIGVSGRELKREVVYHDQDSVEEEIANNNLEIKDRDYRELGMSDFKIKVLHPAEGEGKDIENNLALSQIQRRDIVDSEEKNVRKALSNWYHGKHRWTRGQEVFPEDMPLYFKWFNSRDFNARRDEPDQYIKVEKR